MKIHRPGADAPPPASRPPWALVFATPSFMQVIEQFLNAPLCHGDCLECMLTEIDSAKVFVKFLLCNTDLAGRDDAGGLCRRCGQTVEQPQLHFHRLEGNCRWYWELYRNSQRVRTAIEREATLRVEEEAQAFLGNLGPRGEWRLYRMAIQQLSACRGNPLDAREQTV